VIWGKFKNNVGKIKKLKRGGKQKWKLKIKNLALPW
jgi:hypothetical protein